MITCDLIGRLGNQMFQIATTAAHAWRTGQSYAFPTTASGSYTGETYFSHLPKVHPRRPFRIYNEIGHHYTPLPFFYTDIKLNGYWQTEKYFKEYRQEVIDLFRIPIQDDLEQYVAVHVRRGDYLQFADKHPPVTKEYINAAIETIGKNFEPLFFSDDIQWCKENFEGSFYESGHLFDSLSAMASCSHNIIANSSFSWWGAWLNQNPDKIVIAPKVWFGPGNSNLTDRDIVPENWIRL